MTTVLMIAFWTLVVGLAFWCFLKGGRPGGGCGGCGGCGSSTDRCGAGGGDHAAEDLRVQFLEAKDLGPCADCGQMMRSVAGDLWIGDLRIAVFWVTWTDGRSKHPAIIDLILGEIDRDAAPEERVGISLCYRNDGTCQEIEIIDAVGRAFTEWAGPGRGLPKTRVIGTPLEREALDLAEHILGSDPRFAGIETVA